MPFAEFASSRRNFLTTAGAAATLAAVGGDAADAQAVEINAMSPTPEQLQAFMALDDAGPIVMLNLLKFKPGGQAAYMKYGAAVQPLLQKVGAKSLFAGRAAFCFIGDAVWDMVLLVQYPNKQAFLEMINSAEYQAVHHFREEGLEGQVLYALKQLGGL